MAKKDKKQSKYFQTLLFMYLCIIVNVLCVLGFRGYVWNDMSDAKMNKSVKLQENSFSIKI